MQRGLIRLLLLGIFGAVLAAWVGCSSAPMQSPHPKMSPSPGPAALLEPAEVVITAVGDVMMHMRVVQSARDHESFTYLFTQVREELAASDIGFANLETPVTAKERNRRRSFVFNAPLAILDALRATGFDILSVANNHALDQDADGLGDTVRNILDAGMLPIGSGKTSAEALQGVVLEKNGIRIGWIAATEFTNSSGASPQNRKGPFVLLTRPEAPLLSAVQALRARADVVVVSAHWGNEYQTKPCRRQKALAEKFFAAGADLILGHHPHVLQPLEAHVREDGRRVAVAWSMGNFISNQDRNYGPGNHPVDTTSRDAIILRATFSRARGAKSVVLSKVQYTPVWTENRLVRRKVKGAYTSVAEVRTVTNDRKLWKLTEALARPDQTRAERAALQAEKELLDRQKQFVLKNVGEKFYAPVGTAPSPSPSLVPREAVPVLQPLQPR